MFCSLLRRLNSGRVLWLITLSQLYLDGFDAEFFFGYCRCCYGHFAMYSKQENVLFFFLRFLLSSCVSRISRMYYYTKNCFLLEKFSSTKTIFLTFLVWFVNIRDSSNYLELVIWLTKKATKFTNRFLSLCL